MTAAGRLKDKLYAGVSSLLSRSDAGETISEADWAHMSQLTFAVALLEKTEQQAKKRRAFSVVMAGTVALAAVACVLSFSPIWWDAEVDTLIDSEFASLTLHGKQRLTMEPVVVERATIWKGSAIGDFRLPKKQPGTISVAMLDAPDGTMLLLKHLGNHIRLSFKPIRERIEVALNLEGAVEGRNGGKTPATENYSAMPGERLDLDLYLRQNMPMPLVPQLHVSGLELFERDGDRKPISTISSGTLFLESLEGKKYKLRQGQLLEFKNPTGVVLKLAAGSVDWKFRFHGTTSKLALGSTAETRDITPSLLEWIATRHSLELFWAATVALVGLLVGTMKLMGMLNE